MALESVVLNAGFGGDAIAVDTVGAAKVPVSKILFGGDGLDGGFAPGDGTYGLDVDITRLPGDRYEPVAAGQTAQVLGATGAAGDYLAGLLVVPASTSPGAVTLLDDAVSLTVFAGGANSVSNLVPFFIPLGIRSVNGAWKITSGANVSVIAVGSFS